MVVASSHEIRRGSPGFPLTKLALFETMVVISPLTRSWERYAFIHAPERLPARAYGSKYHNPMCRLLVLSVTSQTRMSGCATGTFVTGVKLKLKSSPATQKTVSYTHLRAHETHEHLV